jgi:hypothetical protein
MFSAISAIATVTVSGITGTVASTGWLWLLFFMAVPLLLVSWRTPDTHHTAGLERGDRHLNFYETRDNLCARANTPLDSNRSIHSRGLTRQWWSLTKLGAYSVPHGTQGG